MVNSKRILFFLFLALSSFLMAQHDMAVLPQEAYRPDSVGTIGKKAAQSAWGYLSSYNGSYSSDYWVYFQWSGYTFQCDCSSGSYNVKLNIDGVDYWPGVFAGASYTAYGCRVGLGPSRYGTCGNVCYEGGGHNYFLFGCLTGCGANWHSTSNQYYSTAYIRPPVSPVASDSVYDYRIDLSWGKSTDIPDADHGYLISRDGIEIAKVFNGQKTYSDMTVGPNKIHTYTIQTIWPDNQNYTHISQGVTVTGSTFDLNLNASTDQPASVNLTWNSLKSIKGKSDKNLEYYKIDRYDEVNNKLITIPVQIDNSSDNYPDESSTLIPGFLYKYTLRPFPEEAFFPDTAWGKALPNGRIKGKVLSPTGQGVTNIKVCAIRLDQVPQDTTSTYCAFTDTAGTFEIRDIYYYLQSKFRVIPIKEGHGFDPVYEEPTVYKDAPWLDGIVFTDTSVFSVMGKVVQQGNRGPCPVKDVEIFVNGREAPETKTDEDGSYAFSVGQINNYTIKPVLEEHGFVPVQVNYRVNSDTTIATFIDTTTFVLSGVVKASCDVFIGRAKLNITSGKPGEYCHDTIIMTDTITGYYEIRLPAREYEISVLEFFSVNPDVENSAVESYFNSTTTDLTFGNATQNFIYRSQPVLLISGFTEYGCGEYEGIPIIGQGYKYKLNLEIRESFGDISCLAGDAWVVIQNHTGNASEETDTVYLEDGTGEYYFIPGDPNLISPYLKNLTITGYVGSESVTKSLDVLVQGNKPREQTFTTVSPQIPFMILRDPPGDASYSYLQESTTTETAMKLSALASGSLKTWAEVKAGAKFESGFGVTVETEIWGKVRGSLDVGASISRQDEFTLSITNGEQFSTSGNQDVTGEAGDVFAGSALNIIYALTDVIKYDAVACEVNKSVALSMGVDGFATTFIYTDSHIRNVLIPQLTYLRNHYLMNDNDSSKIYSDQIDVWQQTLKLNEDLKNGSSFIENRSFSSGTSYESFAEISTKKTTAIQFALYIEASVAAEAGIEVAGVGVSGGVEVKLRTEFGAGSSISELKTRKTGFVLNDDDGNDYFSVNIMADEVYGTPVFKSVSGSSSCPWEPGTQPREGVQLTSDAYLVNVDDPNGQAVFHFQLSNISQSNEDMIYNLTFDQGSNPDGAVITIGGSQVQGGIPIPFYISTGGYKEATVTVRRGPEAFDYTDLLFTLSSKCLDPAIADSVLLDVHFESPCSNLSMKLPLENWHVSSLENNRLKVRLENYDRELLDFIKLQISPKGQNKWQTVSFLDKTALNPMYTETVLLLDQFSDGAFDLRAILECNAGSKYSESVSGVIDRLAPELYGLPEPSDLVLDSSEMIMAIFNEEINCYKFSSAMVNLKNVSKDISVVASAGCSENMITIIPDLSGTSFVGDTFNVELTGIGDKYGNLISAPVSWTFVINANPTPQPDSDTDNDGLKNSSDNCPWSANPGQEDMDSDGKGDICDEDIDGDDVENLTDNCMLTANPDQKDVNLNGIGDICEVNTSIQLPGTIEGFQFFENHPNPFTDKTALTYVMPVNCYIILKVYDVVGNEVETLVNRNETPGKWVVTWDSELYNEGVYFCTIYAESLSSSDIARRTIKMVKIR